MARQFDVTIKYLVESHPADWLALAGLPPGTQLEIVDADVSSISAAADKVIRVAGPAPYIAHLEFQASSDADLDRRVLFYNVMLRWRHGLPVRSVVFLLRPQAQTGISGQFKDVEAADEYLDFKYRLVRVWEQPLEAILGSIGTAPLALIGDVGEVSVSDAFDRMKDRLDRAVPVSELNDSLISALVLGGLRHSRDVLEQLMKGVRSMEESVMYQMIMEKGFAKGVDQGIAKGIDQGIARGIDQGRAQEAKSLLLKIAARRFGAPSPEVARQIDALTDRDRLETLVEHVIDASGWEDLLTY